MKPIRPIRSAAALCLALVIALTSGAMAAARGQTHAAGQIVVCTAQGPVAIAIDAQGQPVEPGHVCPDCALHVLAAPVAPDVASARVARPARHVAIAPLCPAGLRPVRGPPARAPPLA